MNHYISQKMGDGGGGRDALQCVSTGNEKFKNKYLIPSARLQGYDYSQNGVYFITICTKNREHFFGEMVETHCNASLRGFKTQLSEIGKIVAHEWQKTTEIRKNIALGEWVVMPNHFHGIIFIQNNNNMVETHCNASLQDNVKYKNKFGPQSQNLSAIIRGFKGATTKQIHSAVFLDFAWQPRFHDRIIRNENELNRISKYIIFNPENWEKDDYFK